jgi:uncharacterized protein
MPWARPTSFALAVALLVLSSLPAVADCEAGFEALEKAQYERAFRYLVPCAEGGDPIAQFNLGLMYDLGDGVPQDDAEAARWYRRAAEQGVVEAQNNVGHMYASGKGVLQDDVEALRWYRMAADQGHAKAQHNVGVMYFYGKGVPQDYISAYVWSNLAAARFPEGEERDRAVRLRDEVAVRLSPAEGARGQELARDWRPRVAARSEGGAPAYGHSERGERPRTQRQAGPNPFRAEIERRARRDREVQQLLADLGYNPGPVDGVIGPQTRAAVRDFQADVGLSVDGEISDELYAALTDAVSSGQRVAAQSAPTERRLDSTGTGFAVSQDGHLPTNHHVVADCAEVRVQPQGKKAGAAVIVARDPDNDLALLQASVGLPSLAYLNDRGIRPGDSVVAVGFPLPGLLAPEANVTTGTLSAMAGIGNATRYSSRALAADRRRCCSTCSQTQ